MTSCTDWSSTAPTCANDSGIPTARFTDTPVQIIVPMADRYVTPPSSTVWRSGRRWCGDASRTRDIGSSAPTLIRSARWVHEVIAFVEEGVEADDLAVPGSRDEAG